MVQSISFLNREKSFKKLVMTYDYAIKIRICPNKKQKAFFSNYGQGIRNPRPLGYGSSNKF